MSKLFSLFQKFTHRSSKLSLRWKIYLALICILLPVFSLTIFIQTKLTQPLLEEEVRQVGASACRSLSTEIVAFKLLNHLSQLETRLVETAWLQPSIVRLDVIVREGTNPPKIVASNIVEETPPDVSAWPLTENPQAEYKEEGDRRYWQILYPIKDRKRLLAHIHAEVSLQLADQIVGMFTKIAFLGAGLATGLLILILSYYLRRMIENERRLRQAESQNIELTEQLHEIQQQLFLSEKLAIIGQLTASFAHEIGTPLNSVSGHLQLLRDEISSDPAKNRLEIINSQLTRIEGIVREFLASTHTPVQQRELVDIRAVVERIIKLVTPRVQALRADVQIHIPHALEPIRLVPTDLEQVLLNLTNNALDALQSSAEEKRKLVFSAQEAGNHEKKTLEIHVEDTGEGMPAPVMKKVLKPFFTTKAPGKGTGLGLTISQRLVKKYGGKLDLDSTLGKGTTVKVSIPYELS